MQYIGGITHLQQKIKIKSGPQQFIYWIFSTKQNVLKEANVRSVLTLKFGGKSVLVWSTINLDEKKICVYFANRLDKLTIQYTHCAGLYSLRLKFCITVRCNADGFEDVESKYD